MELPPPILISIISLLIILSVVFFVKNKKKGKKLRDKPWDHLDLTQFISGICIALIGAGIMFHGNIFGETNSSIATVIGIIGIALIGTSYRFKSIKRQ